MPSAEITKRVIADAMKQLMEQKPLAKISVGDIVEVCGINRNSFYYHFRDKYDLVNWISYTEITQDLNREDTLEGPVWNIVKGICIFLGDNKTFYQNALSVKGQNSFEEYFYSLLKTFVKTRTKNTFANETDRDFFATFYADAIVAAICRWLTSDTEQSAEELAEQIKRSVLGASSILLEQQEKE
ncbi:TetR/AcrR family transcriptional regulator [Ruminococcaceae bacterium OttesenSCG-928-I18]|nr:TetR/AcrR family transcriptional regulator [Ruminococcaceae bacterium OttesenSCG-928-I18]